MPLTHQDFQLSAEQLAAINRYFEAKAQALAQSGDRILCPTLNVHFSFAPVFGRSENSATLPGFTATCIVPVTSPAKRWFQKSNDR